LEGAISDVEAYLSSSKEAELEFEAEYAREQAEIATATAKATHTRALDHQLVALAPDAEGDNTECCTTTQSLQETLWHKLESAVEAARSQAAYIRAHDALETALKEKDREAIRGS